MTHNWINGAIIGAFVGATLAVLAMRLATGTRYDFRGIIDYGARAWTWYLRLIFGAAAIGIGIAVVQAVIWPQPDVSQNQRASSP